MKTRYFLSFFIATLTAVWAWDALYMHPMSGTLPWVVQRHGLYLTGILSIGLMSLVMVLATRPAWLEGPMGGMDKLYNVHKWAGILAVLFGAAHWLVKLGSSELADLIGKEGRPAKEAALFFAQSWRSPAKDLGEWAIYILLGLLVLALWKRLPYRPWRALHRSMPVIYLILVFHTVALLPASYWVGATGVLMAVLLPAGSLAAVMSLAQRIGQKRRHAGRVFSIAQHGDVLEVVCEPDSQWPAHRPGQFAFLTFDRAEGAHPFTIACAAKTGSRRISFQIKALGDYTRTLGQHLYVGQPVQIEGPYGRLDYRDGRPDAAQVWVAGGIGVTPFLAWLEHLKEHPTDTPVHMHYCIRDAGADPLVERVRALCSVAPNVTLHIHDTSACQRLDADGVLEYSRPVGRKMDVWFCGPVAFAKSLEADLRAALGRGVLMHREAFDMR